MEGEPCPGGRGLRLAITAKAGLGLRTGFTDEGTSEFFGTRFQASFCTFEDMV